MAKTAGLAGGLAQTYDLPLGADESAGAYLIAIYRKGAWDTVLAMRQAIGNLVEERLMNSQQAAIFLTILAAAEAELMAALAGGPAPGGGAPC